MSAVDVNDLDVLVRSLRHRGPDDDGTYHDGCVGLGHNRLSIIDLSPRGHQPMFSVDGNCCLVFNGEIYNFRELRDDLLSKGHTFRSKSDSEVILNSYEEYGFDCVSKFRGMFAFALWDSQKQTLFLARDRLGKKPIYYYTDGKRFAFASEIKALLKLRWLQRKIDPAALHTYFALQYISGPRTVFEGISKLLPGHYLVVRNLSSSMSFEHREYWQPTPPENIDRDLDRDPAEVVEELLDESVRLRLVSDVEVGVLLSGGLDSSLLAALAVRNSADSIKTFSVRFRNQQFDEHVFADLVAQQLGTHHYTLVADEVKPETFVKVIEHLDEPLADPACVPTYMIASLAAQHVKVVLSGEGADEIFGGYPYYVYENIMSPLLRIPGTVRRNLTRLLTPLRFVGGDVRKVKRLMRVLSSPREIGSMRWVDVFSREDCKYFYTPPFYSAVKDIDPMSTIREFFNGSRKKRLLEKAMDVDLKVWLPDDLLMKVDKMTMAHSLEARAPYLDHKLVEYVSGLGIRNKISGTKTKTLLKQIASKYLPDEVVRRKKHGFEVPIAQWMLNNFRELAEQAFSRNALASTGILDPDHVRKEWAGMKSGDKSVHPRKLWLAFCFMQWHMQNKVEA